MLCDNQHCSMITSPYCNNVYNFDSSLLSIPRFCVFYQTQVHMNFFKRYKFENHSSHVWHDLHKWWVLSIKFYYLSKPNTVYISSFDSRSVLSFKFSTDILILFWDLYFAASLTSTRIKCFMYKFTCEHKIISYHRFWVVFYSCTFSNFQKWFFFFKKKRCSSTYMY